MIKNVLLIGLGGALGSIARYLFQRGMYMLYPQPFPFGTFGVNIIGCLLIGVFWGLSLKSFGSNEHLKLFFMTGLCGGFTTFSAFTLEGVGLLKEQKTGLFFLYTAGSVIAGLLATYIGMKLTR
jgi:CrcB protein